MLSITAVSAYPGSGMGGGSYYNPPTHYHPPMDSGMHYPPMDTGMYEPYNPPMDSGYYHYEPAAQTYEPPMGMYGSGYGSGPMASDGMYGSGGGGYGSAYYEPYTPPMDSGYYYEPAAQTYEPPMGMYGSGMDYHYEPAAQTYDHYEPAAQTYEPPMTGMYGSGMDYHYEPAAQTYEPPMTGMYGSGYGGYGSGPMASDGMYGSGAGAEYGSADAEAETAHDPMHFEYNDPCHSQCTPCDTCWESVKPEDNMECYDNAMNSGECKACDTCAQAGWNQDCEHKCMDCSAHFDACNASCQAPCKMCDECWQQEMEMHTDSGMGGMGSEYDSGAPIPAATETHYDSGMGGGNHYDSGAGDHYGSGH